MTTIFKEKLLVSISGGETSAMMSWIFFTQKKYTEKYDMIFVFANTGREREETLVFLNNIEKHWGIPIVWVEAVVHHGERKGTTHKVVNFNTASRNGEPFTEVIAKYGIPNHIFLHCTRELKEAPISSYARSIGWTNYKVAIGYRADEPKRINWEKEKTQNHLYILPRLNIRKIDVKKFFYDQPFKLGLKEHQGNCKVCFKKGKRKVLTQLLENPEYADWVIEMELAFENFDGGATNRQNIDRKPYRFYRGYESIVDLLQESKEGNFRVWDEVNSRQLSMFEPEYDYEEECAESCEPFK